MVGSTFDSHFVAPTAPGCLQLQMMRCLLRHLERSKIQLQPAQRSELLHRAASGTHQQETAQEMERSQQGLLLEH